MTMTYPALASLAAPACACGLALGDDGTCPACTCTRCGGNADDGLCLPGVAHTIADPDTGDPVSVCVRCGDVFDPSLHGMDYSPNHCSGCNAEWWDALMEGALSW